MRHLPARRQCPYPEAFPVSYESKTNEFTKRKTTVGGVLRFLLQLNQNPRSKRRRKTKNGTLCDRTVKKKSAVLAGI